MRRQRPGHRIWSFHHRGLLLLAAAVAVEATAATAATAVLHAVRWAASTTRRR